ncbi:MAG: hypothetical protein KGD63_14620 [Candidatus Lokiarchaeota archaeon]|nr:hypothetical protein [Candidatus Lokiarchaeota archaeon]
MKNLLVSAKSDDALIIKIRKRLDLYKNIKLKHIDPTNSFLNLNTLKKKIREYDLVISKSSEQTSIDLLYFANMNNIPTINNYYSVLVCKNKIILDLILRKIFSQSKSDLIRFLLPKSWVYKSPFEKQLKFKKWANNLFPLVFKNKDQKIETNRFNFLVNSEDEVEDFISFHKNLLSSDIYIQKFINCDGFDYKIYIVGDKIFGIKRENPICMYLKEQLDFINLDEIERKNFKIDNEIRKLANVISNKLNLEIYGMDLLKSVNDDKYYLIDLNEFPGFKGIKNNDLIIADYIIEYMKTI